MKFVRFFNFLILCLGMTPFLVKGQSDTSQYFTLDQSISYALKNQPDLKQAKIDEAITDHQIKSSLSGWLPQISATYNVQHNFKLPTSAFGENLVQIGRKNTSNILLQANQAIYSNDVFLSYRASRYTRLQSEQNTELVKINLTVDVSKAFYSVLLSQKQIDILLENIVRQEKQYKDARSRYEFGLVDKTDYQRASITLANSRAGLRRTQETLKARHAQLKQLMGYPMEKDIHLNFDVAKMREQISVDTNLIVSYPERVEYQQLQNRRQLLHLTTTYYKLGFIPNVNGFVNYNWMYLNNEFSELYSRSFPTSAVGLSAVLPIFQGTRRYQNIKIAKLQEDRMEVEVQSVESFISTEYQTALANYKSDFNEWLTLSENALVAKEVYDIIKLQYDEGIKAYVDLIVAETDLEEAQLNQFNALYRVLSSKLDLQRALGQIEVNQ
jgi:outer membrane protein TolC